MTSASVSMDLGRKEPFSAGISAASRWRKGRAVPQRESSSASIQSFMRRCMGDSIAGDCLPRDSIPCDPQASRGPSAQHHLGSRQGDGPSTCASPLTPRTGLRLRPNSPCHRGTNENTNGLLRQYFPRLTNLSGYSEQHLDAVAGELNPRLDDTIAAARQGRGSHPLNPSLRHEKKTEREGFEPSIPLDAVYRISSAAPSTN
jgi:hypothetical protein